MECKFLDLILTSFICFVSIIAQHVSSQLETGSLVQFGNPVQYGVIKKIETGIAEVETVSYMYSLLF